MINNQPKLTLKNVVGSPSNQMRHRSSYSNNSLTKSTKITEKTSDMNEWSSYFGRFLNQQQINKVLPAVRIRTQDFSSTIDPPQGFQRLCSKKDFENYINGTDTIHSLIDRKNISCLQRHKTEDDSDLKKSNQTVKIKVDQCFSKLRNLISDKIDKRKQLGDENRACDIRKMPFFKNFYYITQDYRERILNSDLVRFNGGSHEKMDKKRLNLKQATIIKKNCKTETSQTVKQMKEEEIKYFQLLTRNYIASQSQDYLRKIGGQRQQEKEQLKNLMNKHINMKIVKTRPQKSESNVDKDYVGKLQQFQTFNKESYQNNKIITINDEDFKLFNYVNNDMMATKDNEKKLKKTIQDFTNAFESIYVTPQAQNKRLFQQKRLTQKIHHNNFSSQTKLSLNESDHSSLHSEYEVRIDTLYGQSKALQQKVLDKQEGFGRRVKQLLKLNDINSQIIGYNRSKLRN